MHFDCDQYYTPVDLAERVLRNEITQRPSVCVDTTCGEGNLLRAASAVFDDVSCVGIDRDRKAINSLRANYPDWALSVGNLLASRSYQRTNVASAQISADLLYLNPPFSLGKSKYIETLYQGTTVRSSVAMAHILKSLELFAPSQGAIVIIPESVLYSQTDAEARQRLGYSYTTEKVAELNNSTFKGARANTTIIKLIPGARINNQSSKSKALKPKFEVILSRGGLQVHDFFNDHCGIPFIHSTSLRSIVEFGVIDSLGRTKVKRSGQVNKWVLLLPRVGMPKIEFTQAIFLRSKVQLSDCLFAIRFKTRMEAESIENVFKQNWESFESLYRGTGARYLTIKRLSEWLAAQDIKVLCF